jgi:NAD-dependent SIR2 family protein deacetylase
MRCKHCKTRRREKTKAQRPAAPSRVPTCERCGRPILCHPDVMLGAEDGTLAQLARFGLAITGDPLLELKREGT